MKRLTNLATLQVEQFCTRQSVNGVFNFEGINDEVQSFKKKPLPFSNRKLSSHNVLFYTGVKSSKTKMFSMASNEI